MPQVPHNPDLPPQRNVENPTTDVDLILPGDIISPIEDRPRLPSNDANHTRRLFLDFSCPFEDSFVCCGPNGPKDNDFDFSINDIEVLNDGSILFGNDVFNDFPVVNVYIVYDEGDYFYH